MYKRKHKHNSQILKIRNGIDWKSGRKCIEEEIGVVCGDAKVFGGIGVVMHVDTFVVAKPFVSIKPMIFDMICRVNIKIPKEN